VLKLKIQTEYSHRNNSYVFSDSPGWTPNLPILCRWLRDSHPKHNRVGLLPSPYIPQRKGIHSRWMAWFQRGGSLRR